MERGKYFESFELRTSCCGFFVFFLKGIFNVHVINYFNMHNTFIIPLYQISFEKNNDYYLKFLNNQFYRHQQN